MWFIARHQGPSGEKKKAIIVWRIDITVLNFASGKPGRRTLPTPPCSVLECTEAYLVNAKAGGEDGQDEAGQITQRP